MRKLREDEIEARWAHHSAVEKHPIAIVLEDVRSAYNVGAILRTCDAAGIAKVYVCGITATPDNRKVHKTALGAQDSVPWEYHSSALTALELLRKDNYCTAALEITDSPTSIDMLTSSNFPIALVVGNELNGVSAESLSRCDIAIELTQYGHKHSLNAAVAFGVAAYALVGRYNFLTPQSVRNLASKSSES